MELADESVIASLINQMDENALEFSSSLRFAKLLLALIHKYGKQVHSTTLHWLNFIFTVCMHLLKCSSVDKVGCVCTLYMLMVHVHVLVM